MDFETVAGWLAGGIGSVIVAAAVKGLNITNRRLKMLVVAVVSVALAILVGFFLGLLNITDFTWANLDNVFNAVVTMSTFVYGVLLKGLLSDKA
jgi:ABC-type proline/glycine betaine transport system permease subunit